MKKLFILAPFIIGAILYIGLTSSSTGPGSTALTAGGCSGPGVGCHGTGLTTATAVNIQVLSGATPVTSYTGGSAYTIRLKGTNNNTSSLPKFGFQMTALTSSSATAGTLTAPTGAHTFTFSGVTFVEHSSPMSATPTTGATGATYTVDIPWTAPTAGTGNITVYGMMNLVNGTGSAGPEDKWDSTSLVVPENIAAGTITGTLSVCAGATTTLTCTPAGGAWTSGSTSVATVAGTSGVVTGVAAGTSNITYTVGTSTVSATVTVNAAPTAIAGTASACIGATTTLTSTPPGGNWTSGTMTIATVNATSGVAGGIASGTSLVSYTVAGCSATKVMTVNAAGAAAIAGSHTVCVTSTTTLTNLTPGGTWTSSAVAKATVGSSTGVVTGVAVGTVTISYTATNTCGTSTKTYTMNVNPAGTCTAGVSVITGNEGNTLKVYPNPNNGNFTLNMLSENAEDVHIVIYNLAGMKVKEIFTPTNAAVDVAMPNVRGMYFISATTEHGTYTAKVMVQ